MKATTGTHMVRGGRRGGRVEHFTMSPNLSLCGRFVLPGLGTGKRACKSCVRIGRIVIDHGKGEGCEYSDAVAHDMITWIMANGGNSRERELIMFQVNRAEAKTLTYLQAAKIVRSLKPEKISTVRDARLFALFVLQLNAVARGEGYIKPAKVKREALIMNTAITESEEFHNGGPIMPKAEMPKGDGMVNPNSKSKARSGPAATEPQIALIRKLYGEMDELKPHEIGSRVDAFNEAVIPILNKKMASDLISNNIELVKKMRAEMRATAPKVETPKCEGMRKGVYVLDGEFYRWTISQGSGRPYALRWNGSVWDYDSARGIVRKLTPDMAVTAEQAAAWGHEHDSCVFCSRPLDDSRSREAGYGSTCADNHGLPWG
jgi:hypothetical protein